MEAGPGEYILEEIDVRDTKPAGDCVAEWGSDGRKDAGEEGGATKGSVKEDTWFGFSAAGTLPPEALASETRTAGPIRFFCL